MGCAHERETGALTGLDHPGLVALHDTGVVAGRPYAVMELVEGPSLDDVLRRGPMRVPEVIQLGASVADAIAYVHCRGVVHRDVKPGNILLGADGAPRLSDFGLARVVDAARVTTTGVIEGTPAYIAPEQVRGEAVGPAADVYALGLVLLEALTGRREYDGPPIEAALARLFRDPKVPGDLCGGLAEVLPRMVMRDPDARPSASEVADALRMGSAAAAAAA
jgi:serine/threonine protein kinase